MELLTGKAKEVFENFYTKGLSTWGKVLNIDLFYGKPDIEKSAYYVDFFDSVGIYIHPKRNCTGIKFNHWYYIITNENGVHLNDFLEEKITNDSRQEATIAGIKKVNEIFNSKF